MAGVLKDIMLRGKNDKSLLPLARKVMDAMSLTGYIHFDLNAIRKGAIRQMVNPQYAGVFTRRTSSTPGSLLGESSVPEQLKVYEEIGKVRAKLQKPRKGYGHDNHSDGQRGRGRGFGSAQNRGAFSQRGMVPTLVTTPTIFSRGAGEDSARVTHNKEGSMDTNTKVNQR